MTIQGKHRPLYARHKFLVRDSTNGLVSAKFVTASGFEVSATGIDYREGGALAPVKVPGLATFSDIELSRGVSDVPDFYNWVVEVIDMLNYDGGGGQPAPAMYRDLSIEQLRRDNTVVHTYDIRQAFPTRWKPVDFDNNADEISIEEMTLAYYFFTREEV